MALPQVYDFKPQYKGAWFDGIQLRFTKTVDGITTPLDITGYLFKIDFKINETYNAVWSIEIGTGITVVDAVNGIINIDGFSNVSQPRAYVYDLKMTPPNEKVRVYMKGKYVINQNITE